jgi:hypothetical protein
MLLQSYAVLDRNKSIVCAITATDVLDNVSYAKAYNSEHQMLLLEQACGMMTEQR